MTPAESPRLLTDTLAAVDVDARGAVWKLDPIERDLDANLIALPAGGGIAAHEGPDLDVLVHVVAGAGRLETTDESIDLAPGGLIWLPRRSVRGFTAGPNGLRYLTIHRRRPATALSPTIRRSTDDPAGQRRTT